MNTELTILNGEEDMIYESDMNFNGPDDDFDDDEFEDEFDFDDIESIGDFNDDFDDDEF